MKKYRIEQDEKMIKRHRFHDYIQEQFNYCSSLYLSALKGSGKTYAIYSYIHEYYKENYAYISLDEEDNDYELFIKHYQQALSYSSYNLLVFDSFEIITNKQVLDYIKNIIKYNEIRIILISSADLIKDYYDLISYNKLRFLNHIPLFYDKNEILRLCKLYNIKNRSHEIYISTRGYPLLCNHMMLNNNTNILHHFFESLKLNDSLLEIIKYISLTPYINDDILKHLDLYHEDLLSSLLINKDHEQYHVVDLYKDYIIKHYDSSFYNQQVVDYYKQHHMLKETLQSLYIIDPLQSYQYLYDHDLEVINVLDINELRRIENIKDENIHLLYLKAYLELYDNVSDKKHYQLLKIINDDESIERINDLESRFKPHYNNIPASYYPSLLNGNNEYIDMIYDLYINEQTIDLNIKQDLIDIEYLLSISRYNIALNRMQYYMNLNKNDLSLELLIVIGYLLFKIYYQLGLKDQALSLYHEYRDMIYTRENNHKYIEIMNLTDIYIYTLLNDKENVYEWYRDERRDDEINHSNYYYFYVQASVAYLLEKYDQAFYIYTKLESFFRLHQRILYLSEILFKKACCLLAMHQEERALKNVFESFTITGVYRIIYPYIPTGKYGLELLKTYRKMMKEENVKKVYENSLLIQSYDRYLKTIIKENERITKLYPIIQENTKDKLTFKEMAVLKLIMNGYSNNQICEELVISLPTVKTHISNIYSKFNVKNRVQAIQYALDNDIITNKNVEV